MANEDKKDFNAMLQDSKDMPKFQKLTDRKSIEKYGGDNMFFAPPLEYDRLMRLVPFGRLTTVGALREHLARINSADFTEPITAGIFVSIAAWASFQRQGTKRPTGAPESRWGAEPQISWRRVGPEGKAGGRGPQGSAAGRKNIRYYIQNFEDFLVDFSALAPDFLAPGSSQISGF